MTIEIVSSCIFVIRPIVQKNIGMFVVIVNVILNKELSKEIYDFIKSKLKLN